jgi:hypothetical protein
METRLTAELRGRQMALAQRAAAREGLRLPGVYALAAVAVVLIGALLVNLRRSEQVHTSQSASSAEPRSAAVETAALPKNVPHLLRVRRSISRATEPVAPEFLNPPPLPLSAQERLLLQLAQSLRMERSPALITRTEVVVNHGVGTNAIFELDHQNPSPLQSSLQTHPIHGDLE